MKCWRILDDPFTPVHCSIVSITMSFTAKGSNACYVHGYAAIHCKYVANTLWNMATHYHALSFWNLLQLWFLVCCGLFGSPFIHACLSAYRSAYSRPSSPWLSPGAGQNMLGMGLDESSWDCFYLPTTWAGGEVCGGRAISCFFISVLWVWTDPSSTCTLTSERHPTYRTLIAWALTLKYLSYGSAWYKWAFNVRLSVQTNYSYRNSIFRRRVQQWQSP